MNAAEEIAEWLIRVKPNTNPDVIDVWALGLYSHFYSEFQAIDAASHAREKLAVWLRDYAAQCVAESQRLPVPGPVSEERLAYLRKHTGWRDFAELFRHIDFLTAVLRDCAADGALAIRQQGYQAGWRDGAADMRERAAEVGRAEEGTVLAARIKQLLIKGV